MCGDLRVNVLYSTRISSYVIIESDGRTSSLGVSRGTDGNSDCPRSK